MFLIKIAILVALIVLVLALAAFALRKRAIKGASIDAAEYSRDAKRNSWIALVAAVLIAIYIGCMLVVPALPIAGPGGELSRISRAEFWLILVASFETIWNQWTAGFLPTISDRFLPGLFAIFWLVISASMGWPIAKRDGLVHSVTRFSDWAWSIVVGAPIVSLCVAVNAVTLGPQSRLGLFAWFLFVGLVVRLGYNRFARWNAAKDQPDQVRNDADVDEMIVARNVARKAFTPTANDHSDHDDPSLKYSWARRLMGMTGLGIVWVLMLMLLGTCLPSYDADVREHRMMATRNIYLADHWPSFERQREANAPQGAMMPALFWMNVFAGKPPDPLDVDSIHGMLESVRVNQIVQGMYGCIAIWLLVASLTRFYGVFAAVIVSFAVAAHPGFFELIRLGGGAGEGGMFLVAATSLLMHPCVGKIPCCSLACISAGAIGQGWVLFLLVSVPIATRLIMLPGCTQLRRSILLIFQALVAGFWGGRFVGQLVQAGFLQGRGGEGDQAFLSQYLPFFFSPWSGVGEEVWAACLRILFFSSVHSLHLIPIAVVGGLFSRDRAGRDAAIWFCLSCLLWWMFTPQQDRDWVAAVPLLAWPMASGVVWLRDRGQGMLLLAIGGIALAWSIMVLSAWPTSDNRLLVPLDSLSPVVALADSRQGPGAETARVDIAPSVNRIWNGLDNEQKRLKWLLLGSADAFRWLPKVDLCGTYDHHPRMTRQFLEQNNIGYVVLDWEGWKNRDRMLGTQSESKYRDAIRLLQQSGVFQRVEWEFDSGRAECFEVVERSAAK